MKINRKIAALLAVIISVSFISTPISAADQPYMKAALADLNKAQAFLKRATNDKGRYRKNALNLVGKAISAVNDGIAYDNKNSSKRSPQNSEFEKNVSAYMIGTASDRSDWIAARENLQNALNNLEKATPDKGGFRLSAMNFVRDAIVLVNGGLRDPSV